MDRKRVVYADLIESMECRYSAIYNVQPGTVKPITTSTSEKSRPQITTLHQELTCEYRTFKDGTPKNRNWGMEERDPGIGMSIRVPCILIHGEFA
jgi:hypothetical protein